MRKQIEQVIQQTSMILPYFNEEVPMLCLQNGSRYIPVVALCRMLGLRADTHIPRWRRLVLWCNAQKLPWAYEDRLVSAPGSSPVLVLLL